MTLEWDAPVFRILLDASMRALAVAAAAALILAAARIRSSSVRHRVWTVVLGAMFAMPLLARMTPRVVLPSALWRAPISPPSPLMTGAEGLSASATGIAPVPAIIAPPSETQAASPVSWRMAWPAAAISVYAAGALLLFVRLALGWSAMRRLIRSGRPVSIPGAASVLESEKVSAPLTCGIVRPRIILPMDWRTWPESKLQAVLTHEDAHVGRRDTLIAFAARVNRALFWFHPLAWFLDWRLSVLAEHACDDAVLRRNRDGRAYAATLVEMADAVRRRGERYAWRGAGIYEKGLLRKRIDRVLNGVSLAPVSTARAVAVTAACAAIVYAASAVSGPQTAATAGAAVIPPTAPPVVVTAMLTEQRNPAEVSPTAPAQAPQENAPPDSAAIARSCLENLGNGDAMPFKEVAYGSPEPPPYVVIAVPVNTLYIDGETRTADDVLCYVTSAYVGLSGRIGRQPTPTEAIDRVSFLAPYDAPNDKARPAGWWVVHRSSGGSAYLWSAATNGHIGRARPSPDGRYLALQYWGVFDDKQTSSEFIDIVDLPALIREKRYVLRNPRIGPAAYNILGWDGADLRFDSSILLATYPSSTRHPRLLAPEVFRWKSSARDIEPESPALRDPVAYYCNGLLDTAGKEGLQLWMRRDLSRQGLNAFKSTPPPPACREKAAFAQ